LADDATAVLDEQRGDSTGERGFRDTRDVVRTAAPFDRDLATARPVSAIADFRCGEDREGAFPKNVARHLRRIAVDRLLHESRILRHVVEGAGVVVEGRQDEGIAVVVRDRIGLDQPP
jgi:hypothetical protein